MATTNKQNLDVDEQKIVDYFNRIKSLKGDQNAVYCEIRHSAEIDSLILKEKMDYLVGQGILRLTRKKTIYYIETKTSEDIIKVEIKGSNQENRQCKDLFAKPSITEAAEVKTEILRFLGDRNYEVESFDTFIAARHKDRFKVYLIKIESSNTYAKYEGLGTIVMNADKFKTYISRLAHTGIKDNIPTGLGTNIITRFGWHANESEKIRHAALDYASIHYGDEHIFHLLGFMKNMWPKNPLLDSYTDIITKEYIWFEENRVSSSYGKMKRELIGKLEHELFSIKIPSAFRRFFKSVNEIDKWFVITY